MCKHTQTHVVCIVMMIGNISDIIISCNSRGKLTELLLRALISF